MPLPKPSDDETHDDFIGRCMGDDQTNEDFPDNDQRLAVCEGIWDDNRSDAVDKKQAMQEGVCRRAIEAPVTLRQDGDGQSTISGHASVFFDGTPGTEFKLWENTVERIMPGTFDRALKEKDDVRGLFNHDPSLVLGRTSANTMDLSIDKRGLRYDIRPGDTTIGKDVVEHIARGDVTGSSFAFRITDETWRTEDDVEIREIRGVELFDVGPVTFPAYTGADTGVRDEARASYDKWKAGSKPPVPVASAGKREGNSVDGASDEWLRKTKEKLETDLARTAGS